MGEYKVSEISGKEEDKGILPFIVTFLGGSRMDAETLEIVRRLGEGEVMIRLSPPIIYWLACSTNEIIRPWTYLSGVP